MQTTLKSSNFNIRLLLISIVLIISLLLSQYLIRDTSPHALKKHGVSGEITDTFKCLDDNGSTSAYYVFEHNEDRRAWLCFEDGDWFVLFTKEGEDSQRWGKVYDFRTAYKIDMKRHSSIENYIKNQLTDRGGYLIDESLPAGQQVYGNFP